MKQVNAGFDGKGKKICLVVGRFNEFITSKLLSGALDCLTRHGVAEDDCTAVWVPGAFEIPAITKRVAESGKYDAVICLGALIRGQTPHFEYISQQVSKGVAEIALKGSVPVSFGVLTSDSIEQSVERAGTKMGNKGWDAALTALEMINLYSTL